MGAPATQSILINLPDAKILFRLSAAFRSAYTSAGSAAFTLSFNGSSFMANSTVHLGSAELVTTYVTPPLLLRR